jgi:CelD/BcsL family acetyltransferase involved in cellulose biosynthesis
MSASSATVRRLPLSAVGPAEEAAWSALAARTAEDNPFFRPELLLPAGRHLAGGGDVDLLVVRDGERWLGCAAVVTRPKFSDLLLPCVRTWNHPYGFLWTPLVDEDAVEAVAGALTRAPALWRARAFLVLEAMAEGPLSAAVLAAPPAGRTAPFAHSGFARAAVRRRAHDDYVATHVGGKQRREMRRTRRILAELLGGEPVLVDASEDDGAAERFLALESGGWKGRAGSALASDPAHAAFFRELWSGFRARGEAHLLELRGGGRTAASVLCLTGRDTVFALKIGYDEELGRGAPGIHLMADLASWFHDHTDASLMDSCAIPDHPMINGLWPDRRPLTTLVLPAPGVLGRAAGALDARVRPKRESA